MLADIKDILIISAPEYHDQFVKLLGDGSQWGVNFQYEIQDEPNGIVESFVLGESFIGDDNVCLILGDNILYGNELTKVLKSCQVNSGATVLTYEVQDPHRFGIVEYTKDGKAISIEEKPKDPKSNRAIVGIYFYDNSVVKYAKEVIPSARGELEITDLNKIYLNNNQLNVIPLCRGMAWIDSGTFDSLLMASNFISTVEKIQGKKISCPEEIAYRKGWIDNDKLLNLASTFEKSGYGKYLKSIVEEER